MDSSSMKSCISLVLKSIPGIPFVEAGDDLTCLIPTWLDHANVQLMDHDVLVVAHKIVSRAEGRVVKLVDVRPGQEARNLSIVTGRDARLCQIIMDNGKVLYTHDSAIMTEDSLGIVNTSAGIDRSNSGSATGDLALLLPVDPDSSARKIGEEIKRYSGRDVAVLISDSLGRPWRRGSVGMAIGVYGIDPILRTNAKDLFGRTITPEIAIADEIVAGAALLMGEADEGTPVVLVRGLGFTFTNRGTIEELIRPVSEDQVW